MMNKLVAPIALIAFCVSIACLVLIFNKKDKIVFVNIESVYSDFTMKKELELKFDNVTAIRQQILDSLKLELNILSQKIKSKTDLENIQQFQLKRQEYALKEQNFAESTQLTNDQYKDQIWKQLSQYISQYGKKNKFKYILGFENKSSILYGDEAEDVTKEIVVYVNEMYKGGSK